MDSKVIARHGSLRSIISAAQTNSIITGLQQGCRHVEVDLARVSVARLKRLSTKDALIVDGQEVPSIASGVIQFERELQAYNVVFALREIDERNLVAFARCVAE